MTRTDRDAPAARDGADGMRGRGSDDDIYTQAIVWHVRLLQVDADERQAFDRWIAEDPRHASAFDAIRETTPERPEDETPLPRAGRQLGRYGWIAGGLTAITVAGLVVAQHWRADPFDVTTAAGERRVVVLDAGTRVTLNGGTRMRFDRRDPRVAALLEGEALFQVRHDPARPFRLDVAGRTIEDVGTVFNVVSEPDEVRVAVADGAVIYDPDHEAVTLHPGQGLVDAGTSDRIERVETPADGIGGWRSGQFRYVATPLSTLAADLSRALGTQITVMPAIGRRPFSGAITLDGTGVAQLPRLMPALDARLVRTPTGWTIGPRDRAPR